MLCLLLSDLCSVAFLRACSATLPPTSPQGKYCSSPLTISVPGAGWWTVAGLPWLPLPLEMASLQTATASGDGFPPDSHRLWRWLPSRQPPPLEMASLQTATASGDGFPPDSHRLWRWLPSRQPPPLEMASLQTATASGDGFPPDSHRLWRWLPSRQPPPLEMASLQTATASGDGFPPFSRLWHPPPLARRWVETSLRVECGLSNNWYHD